MNDEERHRHRRRGADDGHDPSHPPPGCEPGVCVACGGAGQGQALRKAVGPIPGTDLVAGEVGSLLAWTTCRTCLGRGWTWIYSPNQPDRNDPETPTGEDQ